VRWHKLGEVECRCALHNSIVLATLVPKIIEFGEHFNNVLTETILIVFWNTIMMMMELPVWRRSVIGWYAVGRFGGPWLWLVWGRMPNDGTETEVRASWTGRRGCECDSGTWWSLSSMTTEHRDTRRRLEDTETSCAGILCCYNTAKHRCDERLQRLQKKIFVNAFIILSTFISIKITWAKRSRIMTGSQAIVHCIRSLIEFIGSRC